MKQISETIDGSIKNVIQLKTLDGSLEWSQMFDALNDCPAEFQNKLVGALNSIAETKDVPATQVFKLVLCGNSDEDVCKKLYNWWRGLFDILSRCKIPEERVGEYDEKVDALMAEITKAGNDLEMNEEPAVVTEGNEDLGYEQADKDDEEEMLQNMEFAIQHIGEIANKVKELVNFVNPYCGTQVNESMDKPVRYNVGDRVLYKGEEYVVTTIDEFELPDEELYGISRDSDKVPGLSFNEWAIAEELEPVPEKFTEEDKSIMKNMNERGGDSEWVSMDSLIGVQETSEEFKVGDKITWKHHNGSLSNEIVRELADGGYIVDGGYAGASEVYPGWVDENLTGMANMELIDGEWQRVVKEGNLENELNKGDDGWIEIGQPVGEATVVVDADTVWDVLELLDDDVANQNLTELINSHTRSEEEIMDAIENILGASGYSDNVPKAALNGMFSSENIHELIGELGLDVDAYMDRGEIQDADKPTSVELESDDMKSGWENLDAVEFCDWMMDYSGTFTAASGIRIENATPKGDDEIAIDLSYAKKNADIGKFVDSLLRKVANWQFDGKIEPERNEDGSWHCEIKLNKSGGDSSVKLENTEDQKPEEVKSQDKTFNADGENKTLVAGEERKPVCEMTIEQEVDNPWNLAEMLWGQGKENLEELLRSGVVDEDYVMQMLEEMELRNLTNINDAFAYDFESILDTFGCDPEAWSQHLKIVKKGDSVDDDDE